MAAQAGSSIYESRSAAFTINGGGDDIWGGSDKFRFLFQDSSGDCEITAKVAGLENTNEWAKAGVIIRESASANAPFVMVIQRPDKQIALQWRIVAGGNAAWSNSLVGGTSAVKYVRVTRVGNKFRGSYKLNAGDPWIEITSGLAGGGVDIPMATAAKLGLGVTAHTPSSSGNEDRVSTGILTDVVATP